MKKAIKVFFVFLSVTVLFAVNAMVSVSAAPEDYLNDIVDNISSAVEHYFTATEADNEPVPTDTATQPPLPTVPVEEYTEYYDDYDDDDYDDYDYPTEVPTQEVTEEATFVLDDEPDENYQDYAYEPPTEEATFVYEPEILTETHTDPPFLERFAITDDGEGNVFIALGLWLSILSGITIVLSVLIATHKRKKGR